MSFKIYISSILVEFKTISPSLKGLTGWVHLNYFYLTQIQEIIKLGISIWFLKNIERRQRDWTNGIDMMLQPHHLFNLKLVFQNLDAMKHIIGNWTTKNPGSHGFLWDKPCQNMYQYCHHYLWKLIWRLHFYTELLSNFTCHYTIIWNDDFGP